MRENLADQYDQLLQSTDRLLSRYKRLRKRKRMSLAGRILSPILLRMHSFGAFLTEAERQALLLPAASLWERYRLLEQRRIPLCPMLCRLHRQCHSLERLMLPPKHWQPPSVLVGSLRKPSQLDISLIHGFYHIPACHIPPQQLPIDYVAIYQSRSLFPKDCGIRFYGKVRNCTLVQRWEIDEIPKSSEELYYRLDISAWEQLEEPVRVREIPFTHLFTNLFLLTHSQETPELALSSPEEYCCFQSLRSAVRLGDGAVFHYRSCKIRLKNGCFQIYRHGRKLAAFRAEDFLRTPAGIFKQIRAISERTSAR